MKHLYHHHLSPCHLLFSPLSSLTLTRVGVLRLRCHSSSPLRRLVHTSPLPVAHSSSSPAPSSSSPISVIRGVVFPLSLSLRLLSACAPGVWDGTVQLVVVLHRDKKNKTPQSVRGVCLLPGGSGKKVTVAVFARGEKASEARLAGADLIGAEDLIDKISTQGLLALNIDRCISTPDCMSLVSRIARVLGPKGLMPNPRLGSVTVDVKQAVTQAKQGEIVFKSDKMGIISCPVGKESFSHTALQQNIVSLIAAIMTTKPTGIKHNFIKCAYLHSSHGPSIPLDIMAEPFKQQQKQRK